MLGHFTSDDGDRPAPLEDLDRDAVVLSLEPQVEARVADRHVLELDVVEERGRRASETLTDDSSASIVEPEAGLRAA